MRVYLANPRSQQQAEHASDMPVLLCFNEFRDWLNGYHQSFDRILIDSGAFAELNSGAVVDIASYRAWSERWRGVADAIAGLDDIRGDWRRSLKNYAAISWTFPTIHDTDPPELLPDLVALAKERGGWLGVGIKPPRQGKEAFVRWVCENVPEWVHIHGWALRAYTHIRRIDSVDSTNWWRDAMALRKDLPWLTYGECLELIVKRYIRWNRIVIDAADEDQLKLEIA
jgi:hypothetical protein